LLDYLLGGGAKVANLGVTFPRGYMLASKWKLAVRYNLKVANIF